MTSLCHSRNSPHYKAFMGCAAENWEVQAEKELDAVIDARDDHVKNHKHDYKDAEAGAPALLHGDDEVRSLLNDVVSKALFDNKSDHGKKSDIKMIDLSDKNLAATGHKPLGPSGLPVMPAKSAADVLSVERKILNDPNTVMVFMDDSRSPLHPPSPPHHSNNLFGPQSVSTTAMPHSNDKAKSSTTVTPHDAPTKASIQTTSKPITKEANKPPPSMKPAPPTTKKPHEADITTTSAPKKPAPAPSKGGPKPSAKGEPSSRGSIDSSSATTTTTTTVAPKSKTTTSAPTRPPTEKPLETLEAVLKRQEAEKIEFERRLKMERDALIRRLQKQQDEIDAQNAIAAMQSHRSHATDHDSRMHQIEHDRQMSIDPIGHSLKHQQYEMRRQQRYGGR